MRSVVLWVTLSGKNIKTNRTSKNTRYHSSSPNTLSKTLGVSLLRISTTVSKSNDTFVLVGLRIEYISMKTIDYTDGPIGQVEIVPDFLPTPKNLVLQEEKVKVTLSLNKSTLDFFKQEASQHQDKYQRMIRVLLDKYVADHTASPK